MMMPDEESAKINIDEFGSSRLLHDIEEISKALYIHDTPKTSNLPKDDLLVNGKKHSIWKWKPLKALSHIRNHRLTCSFFLHIHSIEGLPLNFNDLSLCIYWKRKHEILKSQCARVKDGVAEFEETLIHRCSVYVSKRGPHDDVAKYAPKLSLLYASIAGAPNLDIGKHWIDLTRLLPLNLMELEDEKNRFGKWITSFKLTGKAKGAIINVSFGFSLLGDNFWNISGKENGKMLKRVGSIPSNSRRRAHVSNLSLDMNKYNGIKPYEGPSISLLYELLDDAKSGYSKDLNSVSNEVYDEEFTVIDKGVEFDKSVENSCIETIDVSELFDDFETKIEPETEFETVIDEISCSENNNMCIEESNEELDFFLDNLSISESRDLDFLFHEHDCEKGKMVKSRSLDDLTNIVVNDFMNLVGYDSEPDSPRERLWREFEDETLASGSLIFDLDDDKKDQKEYSNIFDSSFLFPKVETKLDYEVGQSLISRRKAKMLENLETDELMQKWGLNEHAFQNSPRTDSGAFGSPVYLSPERSRELPPIGNGLGPFLKINNDGFLRSMNPLLFKKAKNGEKLILQVTNSVVLPMELGSNGMDILMKWAGFGYEKMGFQVARLMPVEEITGKTLQQAVWESESEIEREHKLLHESPTNIFRDIDIDTEYVSIQNIIPLAIEKIQYLLIEGLKIQSGISTENPPSTINSTSTTNYELEQLLETSIPLNESINSTNFDFDRGYFSNFTLSLQMLLRDPIRDYEPVGIPMLALIEVERSPSVDPMFKVKEVFVAGFKADPQKKQQSGSRWLYSSGMTGKPKKHPLTKSTALIRSSIRSMNKMKHEEMLWSISCCVDGEVVRNPGVIFK